VKELVLVRPRVPYGKKSAVRIFLTTRIFYVLFPSGIITKAPHFRKPVNTLPLMSVGYHAQDYGSVVSGSVSGSKRPIPGTDRAERPQVPFVVTRTANPLWQSRPISLYFLYRVVILH